MQQSQNNISANQYSFEALFNYATIGIIVTDKNGIIINFNKQAEKDFGYKKDEVINKPIEILIPPSFKTKHEQYRQGYYKHPSRSEERRVGKSVDIGGSGIIKKKKIKIRKK